MRAEANVSTKDYYQLLGIARDASSDDVQKAFRQLARKFHPDVNKAPGAEDKFKQLNEAHEVLKDPEKRRLYDQFGSNWKAISEGRQAPPGQGHPGFDFGGFAGGGGAAPDMGSIFEQFFAQQQQGGAAGGRRRGGGRPRAAKGEDVEAMITLDVTEAYRGMSREIGIEDSEGVQQRLTVKIPPAVRDGQKIRLKGRGHPGVMGGPPGDLLLVVKLAPTGQFRLEDENLHTTLPVSPWEAALGATVEVQTLDGALRLKVPAGSSSGRQIRLRGKGYPKADGEKGDLFATVQVRIPESLTDEERRLFEELQKASSFNPRAPSE